MHDGMVFGDELRTSFERASFVFSGISVITSNAFRFVDSDFGQVGGNDLKCKP